MSRFSLKKCIFAIAVCGIAAVSAGEPSAFAGQAPGPLVPNRENHYEVSWAQDLPLTFFAGFSSIYGNYLLGKMSVDDRAEMPQVSDLLPWDRPVAGRYNKTAADVSSWLAVAGVAPLAMGGLSWYRGDASVTDFAAYTLMFAQALALQNGLDLVVRSFKFWPRPYMYSTEGDGAAAAEAAEGEAYGSFFSGHASAAFTVAVFTGEWFSEIYPNSRYKSLVWAGSLSLAGFVGALRIAAGKHYPSDVVVGALAGTGISFAVIKLHKKSVKIGPVSLAGLWADPGSASATFVF